MAWDDTPPDTLAWDATPPTKEELPSWKDLPGNIGPDALKLGKGAVETGLRTAKGIYDLPADALETAKGELSNLSKGENPFKGITESPIGQDIKTVGGGLINTAKAIPGQIGDLASKEAWVNRPVQNALTAGALVAPFLKGGAAAKGAAMAGREAPIAEAAAEAAIKSPKELPISEPGLKTGDPHALFNYEWDQSKLGGKGIKNYFKVFGDPEKIKEATGGAHGWGTDLPEEVLQKFGIPATGRMPETTGGFQNLPKPPEPVPFGGKEPITEPPSRMPPDPNAPIPPKPPAAKADPLQEVRDYVLSKTAKATSKAGWPENVARYLKEEANDLGAKDIGLNLGQIKSMGQDFHGLDKASALVDYAREKGYLNPSLTDVARKAKITTAKDLAGKNLGAIRDIATKRAQPPLADMLDTVKKQLTNDYGIDAPSEVQKVVAKIEKAAKDNPTFAGMADLATELNKSKTPITKMGQHPGPTTDAANIIGRMNNDAIRATLNPQEAELYTQSLRDFGAHKKLEQAAASAGRKKMASRSGAVGDIFNRLWQGALDRGGYRVGGNVASKVADTILKNPGKVKTLPQFFEELAHSADDVIDEAIQGPGMFKGGRVPDDVRDYVHGRC